MREDIRVGPLSCETRRARLGSRPRDREFMVNVQNNYPVANVPGAANVPRPSAICFDIDLTR